MKRKPLLLLALLFLVSSCNSSSNKKVSEQSESSSLDSSAFSSSQSIPVSSATTQVPPTSSQSGSSSSTSTPPPPIDDNFHFSESELTIDISSSHSASLKVLNNVDHNENIAWSVPHSSVIRFDKGTTKHDETNTINAINIGDIRLKGEANGKTAYCDIHVINSKTKPASGTQNISIYAINDYHGAVTNDFSIKHLGTLIKQKVQQSNTLFLDQGDTFQGTLQSNHNYGRLITDVYNAAGMSARTVGNHDFDWGDQCLKNNTSAEYHGYSTPVLAANVYDFNFQTKETGSQQQSEIGQEYSVFTLESGIKVGVIGLIGESCITSINSQFVENYSFTNAANVTKTTSNKLRSEENCDVIIASIHDGYDDNYAAQVTNQSPQTHKKYVDLVLNAHTHAVENEEYNGVKFVQFGSKCQSIGKINLKFDYASGTISETSVYNLSASSLISDVPTLDSEISDIVDTYNQQVDDIKDEVLTTQLNGAFDQNEVLPNFVSKAIYEASISQGYNVSYAITNKARENLEGPTVTYETLFHSLPFDNVIYIIRVLGSEIMNELSWSSNSMYRGNNADALSPIDPNKTYTIACIDYLAFHCNSSRYYNYFPSLETVGYLSKNDQYYTYREITADYLRNTSGEISSTSYRDSVRHYDVSRLEEAIDPE